MMIFVSILASLLLGGPLGSLQVRDWAGQAATLADLSQYDVVVVNFWAVWCPPCRDELPWLLEAHESGDIHLIAVNVGDRDLAVARFLADEGLEALPVRFVTPRELRGIDVPGLPTTFIVVRGAAPIVHFGPLTPGALANLLPGGP
jgi:thiol-disulfide isomerase/thioredoxin